jgi:hypothetical protein
LSIAEQSPLALINIIIDIIVLCIITLALRGKLNGKYERVMIQYRISAAAFAAKTIPTPILFTRIIPHLLALLLAGIQLNFAHLRIWGRFFNTSNAGVFENRPQARPKKTAN